MNSDPDAIVERDNADRRKALPTGRTSLKTMAFAMAVAAMTLALDLSLPLGVAAGVPYVALVLMGIWFSRTQHIYLLAILGSTLTLIGFFASSSGGVVWMVLANRGLALFAIWITALLLASRKNFENELRFTQEGLEAEVAERTQELRDSEARFRDFSETAADWLWETDSDHHFVAMSDEYHEKTGAMPSEFISNTQVEMIARTDTELAEVHRADLEAYRQFKDLCYWVELSDGARIRVNVSGKPLFEPDGKFTGYRGTGRNVTEIANAEAKVEHAVERLHEAIESIGEAFVLYDADDRMVLCNSKFTDLYPWAREICKPGVTFAELAMSGARAHKYPDAEGREEAWLSERIAQHNDLENTLQRQLADGRWILVSNRPTGDGGIVGIRADITEQKMIETALRDSEAQLTTITENLAEGLVTISEEGIVESFNAAAEKMFGYSRDDVVGQNVSLLMPEPFRSEHDGYLRRFLDGGEGHFIGQGPREVIARHKDGTEFVTELAIGESVRGGRQHFIGTLRDISERKMLEATIGESETRLRLITDNLPVQIFYVDTNEKYLWVNRGYVERYELMQQDLLDMTVRDVIGEESYAVVAPHLANALQGNFVAYEYRSRNPSDHGKWFQVAHMPCKGRDHEVEGVIGLIEDITDRKHYDQSLKKSLSDLAEAQRLAHLGSWEHDFATNTVTWSTELTRILGYGDQAVSPGLDIHRERIHPGDLEKAISAYEQAVSSGAQVSVEYHLRLPGGEVCTVRETIKVNLDDSGNPRHALGTVLDITETTRLEEQLLQSQKMEALGTLAGGVAHDLNNTLVPILGLTELVIDDLPADSDARQSLEHVHKAANRAGDLVKQILAFSRKDEARLQLVDARSVILEVMDLIKPTVPATITIEEHLAGDVGQIYGDTTQLYQVVMNLVSNAVHAMDGNGKLGIRLDRAGIDEQTAASHLDLEPVCYARITVADTGPGIDPDIVDRLFDPFFTTKEVGEGTGLGLSVVHGIVTRHGGAITVSGKPGEGTAFEVYLPVMTEGEDGSSPDQGQ